MSTIPHVAPKSCRKVRSNKRFLVDSCNFHLFSASLFSGYQKFPPFTSMFKTTPRRFSEDKELQEPGWRTMDLVEVLNPSTYCFMMCYCCYCFVVEIRTVAGVKQQNRFLLFSGKETILVGSVNQITGWLCA